EGVELLPVALADVPDHDQSVLTDRQAEGVAQAQGGDTTGVRLTRRPAVQLRIAVVRVPRHAAPGLRVDPQDLAGEDGRVLRAQGLAARLETGGERRSVAHPDQETPVVVEDEIVDRVAATDDRETVRR